MGNPNHLPRLALLLTTIMNGQQKPTNMDIDALAPRKVACAPYQGIFGVEAFRTFSKLQDYAQAADIKLDQFGRPTAVGIHLDSPRKTATDKTRYLACVWVPDDAEDLANHPDIVIGSRQGGIYAFSEYIGQSAANSWTHALAMEKQLPDMVTKDKNELGWWEQYAPAPWDQIILGKQKSATIGFRVALNKSDG